ncbi:hypothetical protein GGH95_002450, partial [Coemansia sp. RSA 1836]
MSFPYKGSLIDAIVSPQSASKNIRSLNIEGVQLGLTDLFTILSHLPNIGELRIEPDLGAEYIGRNVPTIGDKEDREDEAHEDEDDDDEYADDSMSPEPDDLLAPNLIYLSVL